MNLQLNNKQMLVTGGSRGIGLAIALSFAREGALPLIVSRSADALQQAAQHILQHTSVQARTLAADLATAAGVQAVVAASAEVDLLVNNGRHSWRHAA